MTQSIKLRRAMMFMPGNNPSMLQNAGIYGADSVIYDLEDAVSVHEKDSARHLVLQALLQFRHPCEVAIRINHIQTPFGLKDLETVLPGKPDLIRLPKAECADEILTVDRIITQVEQQCGFPGGGIRMGAAIDTGAVVTANAAASKVAEASFTTDMLASKQAE